MRRISLLLAATLALGCTDKPKAPALSNDPVYHNSREGFRFIAPEGWAQTAKANLPPGAVDKERLLVRYEGQTGEAPASLEVSCVDASASADLGALLAAPSHSIRTWKAVGSAEPVVMQTASATRYAYRAGESMKETVVFRRADRAYFFTAVYAAKDAKSRDQIRRTIDSVVWMK